MTTCHVIAASFFPEDKQNEMIFGQAKPVVVSDPTIAAREQAEADLFNRRSALNREMMRLPLEERRRRWNEYCSRLDALMKPLPK